MNIHFIGKADNIKVIEEQKKEIPVKNDEDSVVVAGSIQISNFALIRDIAEVVAFIESLLFDESTNLYVLPADQLHQIDSARKGVDINCCGGVCNFSLQKKHTIEIEY